MKKTAIILGASGLTGGLLLNLLLEDYRYEKIISFGRKSLNQKHPKLEEIVCDLFDLKAQKEKFKADEVYCCIGTTAKKTPNKEIYKNIDLGIPWNAASLCKENNIETFMVISALGANSKSSIFYNKTKGDMEKLVLEQSIKNTYILRPSLILGNRNESRFMEGFGMKVFPLFHFLMQGKWKKYRAIKASSIAKTMLFLANSDYPSGIINSDLIEKLSK
ncbi:NAD-dependent epimerase/dehydratase family protein [Aureivirga sp. CE67]|uniref:NAD-dependent epimerase/dehydratase family protein n=1 Tax=Aureivirga sp. CE67 TaxID=1788983 RepID=UPI0018CB98D2|nr:NAD(P)H-binding protein [Aureivirga sp. CE67]